jgi:5-methylcytosine-specific restriction endonuclease McrA
MPHGNKGRKQSLEHIRKRMEAVAKAKAAWSPQREIEYREKVSISSTGRKAWNKGIPQSEEARKKNSEAHRGLQSGPRHWNWGGKMPQESIEKMRQSQIGKKRTPETISKRFDSRKGYTHSDETRRKISETNRRLFSEEQRSRQSGENSPTWKGADHPREYPSEFNARLREMIRERDGRECLLCGAPEKGQRHNVHHQDYDKKNNAPENLKTLCHPCHMKTNHMEADWRKIFRPDQIAVNA